MSSVSFPVSLGHPTSLLPWNACWCWRLVYWHVLGEGILEEMIFVTPYEWGQRENETKSCVLLWSWDETGGLDLEEQKERWGSETTLPASLTGILSCFFKSYFICMSIVCMCACRLCACLVPPEARRWCHIPWIWHIHGYPTLQAAVSCHVVLGTEARSISRAPSILMHWVISPFPIADISMELVFSSLHILNINLLSDI